ncbi:MAG: hypothetical protein IPN20_22685 [Haliscomenobacter sp.]|nr:hypothetical protein [Haliscomenobacter sp.]
MIIFLLQFRGFSNHITTTPRYLKLNFLYVQSPLDFRIAKYAIHNTLM